MALDTEVAFLPSQTSFTEGNFTLSVFSYDTQSELADPGNWTLSHIQRGVYKLNVPNAVVKSIASLVHNSDPLIYADVVLDLPIADQMSAPAGNGSVLFLWSEYEAGHNGDPAYGVPDVNVFVYNNDQATGSPVARATTDEVGIAEFYLDPGTYYLWRRKAGRKFTNPATVEVNFGGNTDSTPENPAEIAFTWTEYETDHDGDPDYVVPTVWVRVFSNSAGSGVPVAYGVTDDNGAITFYLAAGTYYLFRYKSGRVFNNPFQIEVS